MYRILLEFANDYTRENVHQNVSKICTSSNGNVLVDYRDRDRILFIVCYFFPDLLRVSFRFLIMIIIAAGPWPRWRVSRQQNPLRSIRDELTYYRCLFQVKVYSLRQFIFPIFTLFNQANDIITLVVHFLIYTYFSWPREQDTFSHERNFLFKPGSDSANLRIPVSYAFSNLRH